MKAWVLESIGNFILRDVSIPEIPDGWVLVKVKATGICGSDIPRVYENGAHSMPLIIGHEFSGVVEGGAAPAGTRVGVFPLIPCRECVPCRKKLYEMCKSYDYVGSRRDGAFAEYVVVPKDNLINLPDGVSYEAAAMLEPMAVAVHAMRRNEICSDDRILVYGAGTIGILLSLFLLDAGYENVYVIGNKDFQRDKLIEIGLPIDHYYDSRKAATYSKLPANIVEVKTSLTDWIMDISCGNGMDVLFECVGSNETASDVIDFAAAGAKVCMVGNPYSDMTFAKDVYWKILRHQIRLTGTWNSSFLGDGDDGAKEDDWHYVIGRLEGGFIKPEKLITHRFGIDNINLGFEIMHNKSEDYIKIMCIQE